VDPTQLPIQWVPSAVSLRVTRKGRETDNSSPSSTEVQNDEVICIFNLFIYRRWRLHGVLDGLINECGAVGGMRIGKGDGSTRRKPAPEPLCPPQIPGLGGAS
jgi:hypothetical protein